ncbi:MAG: hypothetical protein MZV64_50020 [Ignavibacteriales bacterium]|nr:hypothetical protein [Ignavibacteriales bacterium]
MRRRSSRVAMSGKRDGLTMSAPSGKPRRAAISAVTLLAGQVPAHAGLGRLADLDLDGVDPPQVLGGGAVAVGDVLEDELVGQAQGLGQEAALARAHGRARRAAAEGQGGVGLLRQRPERHVADDDRRSDDQGLFGPGPDDRPGVHRLVAVERQAGQLGALDEDVVPGHDRLARPHRLDDGFPGEGHAVDVGHARLELVGGAAEVFDRFRLPDGFGRRGRRRGLVLEPVELRLGRPADGADPVGEEVVEEDALGLLVVDVLADAAAVLAHGLPGAGYLSTELRKKEGTRSSHLQGGSGSCEDQVPSFA